MQMLSRNRVFGAVGVFVLTGILLAAAYDSAAGGHASSQTDALVSPLEAQEDITGTRHAGKDVYGVVNAGSSPVIAASINARGQAAFDYRLPGRSNLAVGFFDGERTINLSPPSHLEALFLDGLNDKGEVAWAAALDDPFYSAGQPFRWSAARGIVQLPSLSRENLTVLHGVNNRGIIAGNIYLGSTDINTRALQWTSLNRLVPLAIPAGFTSTWAIAINNNDVIAGTGTDASGRTHIIFWNANGRPTVLGTFGAAYANSQALNDRGEIAGILYTASLEANGFLWSPGRGLVRLPRNTFPRALNDAGELAVNTGDVTGATRAFQFSRTRGLVSLHPAGYFASEVLKLNDSGFIVGSARRTANEETRAFRWSRRGTGTGTDLNQLLHNPPAGLQLRIAFGIGTDGTILADSNAGLVILRPAGGGTNAPVLGPIQVNPIPFVNDLVPLTLSFRDRNVRETHTATVDWDDGNGPQPAVVREANGRGEVRAQHTYAEYGPANLVVRVTDSAGRTTSVTTEIYVGETGGFPLLAGSGVLMENASTGMRGTPTAFKLAVPVGGQRHAATPFTFQLNGQVSFTGERLDKVSVDGNTVRLEGTGQFNGRAGYRFAVDTRAGVLNGGASAGSLSVRITQADGTGSAQRVESETGHKVGTTPGAAAFTAAGAGRGSIRLIE